MIDHEHRYYPNSRQKSDTCLICGFNPNDKKPQKVKVSKAKKNLEKIAELKKKAFDNK